MPHCRIANPFAIGDRQSVPRGTIPVAAAWLSSDAVHRMASISNAKISKAEARYKRGESFRVIAKDLQCSPAAIRYHALKGGWQREVAVLTDISVPKEMSPVGNPVERKGNSLVAPAKPLDEIGKEVRSKLATNIQTTLERVSELRPEDMREEVQLETVLGSLTKRAATVFGWAETQSNVLVSVGLLGALPDREVDVTPSPEDRSN